MSFRAAASCTHRRFSGWSTPDDFIVLELAFISGRPKETRLALLKELNARIVAAAGISPDDLMILLSEDQARTFPSVGAGATRVRLTGGLKDERDALPGPSRYNVLHRRLYAICDRRLQAYFSSPEARRPFGDRGDEYDRR